MAGVIRHGSELSEDQDLACDVCVIGSGAGGAVLAAGLASLGLDVVVLEEGGWFTKAEPSSSSTHKASAACTRSGRMARSRSNR